MKEFIAIIITVFIGLKMVFLSQEPNVQEYEELEETLIEPRVVCDLTREDFSQLYALKKDIRKSDNEIVELDQEDAWLLMQIAVHETGDIGLDSDNETDTSGAEAQYLVMMVVMNRVKSDKFPNTIKEVLFQENQFLPEQQLVKEVPNINSHIALAMVEQGIDTSQGAIYFEASTNSKQSWHCRNCEFLYEAYGQRYYK